VLRRLSSALDDLDERVKVTIVGTGVHSWGQRLTAQYNLLYAAGLGASAIQLGLLNSLAGAVGSLASVPLGWATERYSVRRVLLLGYALGAVASMIYASAGAWWMLIPAFILGGRLVRIMPLTDIIFVSATESEGRTGVMSLSRVVWGAINIFAPLAAGIAVAYFGGINPRGIRPLYYIQLVLTVLVFFFMLRALKPLPGSVRDSGDTGSNGNLLEGYREFFKGERWLKRWVLLRLVMQFGTNLALPVVPLWMVEVKGATPQMLGLMGTVGVVVSLLFQIPAGRLADRIGRKKVYFLLRPMAYIGTALLVLAPSPEYLVFVGLLGAIALGGAGGGAGGGLSSVGFTPFITMFWEIVPQEKRGRWFGIEGLLNISAIPASLVGGLLWERGFTVEVLMLPVLLELLIVLPLLASIPETLVRPED
jgi:MFS family permease